MMSYWVLFIGIAVVSWLVQMNLQNKFKKYSKIPTGNGMTGRDVALKMLHDNGIYDVQVTHTPGGCCWFVDGKRNQMLVTSS